MIQNIVRTFDTEEIEDGAFQEHLDQLGKEEFRLHTCEVMGNNKVLTVMERYIEINEAPQPDMDEATKTGGMELKG